MRGHYTVTHNGVTIARADNLLMADSRRALLRYLSGESRTWAGTIAIGASDKPPTEYDAHLGFEFGRGVVNVLAANVLENTVVAKATIPGDIAGEVYELGVYSSINGTEAGQDQLLITDFDLDLIDAVNAAPAVGRVGESSAIVTTTGTGTTEAAFNDILFDLSALGPEDRLVLAYDADSVGTVEVRLMNSPNDYLYYSFTAQPGYNTAEWSTTSMSSAGTGSMLKSFSGVQVRATGQGAAGSIVLDGLRADDTDVFSERVLISRAVLHEPISKALNADIDVEYTIKFEF